MKKFLKSLKSWFNALFSSHGSILSIFLGLVVMALLGLIGKQGQNEDGSLGWGGYFVIAFMVGFWILGLWQVIQRLREQVNTSQARGIIPASVQDWVEKVRGNFIQAMGVAYSEKPGLWIFTLCLCIGVWFFLVNQASAAIGFLLIGHLVLINQLKLK